MSLHCNKQLNDVGAILDYIHCKKECIFTLLSSKTGRHFTYKVQKTRDTYILSVLTGDDNTSSYTRIGRIYPGGYDGTLAYDSLYIFNEHTGCQSAMAARLCVEHTQQYLQLGGQFLVPETCRVCGRMLTTPQAIKDGIGHRCKAKEAKHEQ